MSVAKKVEEILKELKINPNQLNDLLCDEIEIPELEQKLGKINVVNVERDPLQHDSCFLVLEFANHPNEFVGFHGDYDSYEGQNYEYAEAFDAQEFEKVIKVWRRVKK